MLSQTTRQQKKAKNTRLSENEEMRASILALMCGNFLPAR